MPNGWRSLGSNTGNPADRRRWRPKKVPWSLGRSPASERELNGRDPPRGAATGGGGRGIKVDFLFGCGKSFEHKEMRRGTKKRIAFSLSLSLSTFKSNSNISTDGFRSNRRSDGHSLDKRSCG